MHLFAAFARPPIYTPAAATAGWPLWLAFSRHTLFSADIFASTLMLHSHYGHASYATLDSRRR